MTEEEKIMRMLEAQEHPERYSNKDIDDILDDINDVADLKRAFIDEDARLENTDVEEAWNRFETMHRLTTGHSLLKIAASIVGILFVCAFAYAAGIGLGIVSNPFHKEVVERTKTTHAVATTEDSPGDTVLGTTTKEVKETPKVVSFDNEELGNILSQIGVYYNVKVSYASDKVRHIRLHFNWNPTNNLDDVIALLNSFQQINIVREGNVLTVNE